MIPTINKPTRVTRQSATAVNHILTNCFVNFDFKTAIFKSDISNHFPIRFSLPMRNECSKTEPIYIHERIMSNNAIEMFHQKLHETDWAEIETSRNPNVCYKIFLKKIMSLCDEYFPTKMIKLKTKDIQSPWITTGIKKSLKHKQRLYNKFLKTRCKKAENGYKHYKKLFEQIKKHAKRLSNLIMKYRNNIKMTWSVIKEAIATNSSRRLKFPNKINLGSKFITSTDAIAENFNKYFTEIGSNIANKICTPLANFDTYLNNMCNIFQPENALSIPLDAFYSLKTNKSRGYDDISSNIIKHRCFGTLNRPLHYIYNISLQSGVFPEEMKIARVIAMFKGGEVSDLGNYRPISFLCCFSKILEKIMYNRLYKHLLTDNILFGIE